MAEIDLGIACTDKPAASYSGNQMNAESVMDCDKTFVFAFCVYPREWHQLLIDPVIYAHWFKTALQKRREE